ncbi:MAG: hypothetical protein ACREFL_10840 [Stellaceae bacterium]
MAERKVKTMVPGRGIVEGMEVPIDSSNEKWSEVTLEDGTTIRVKAVVSSCIRLQEYDDDGNPLYVVKSTPAVSIVSVNDILKKKVQ